MLTDHNIVKWWFCEKKENEIWQKMKEESHNKQAMSPSFSLNIEIWHL